MVSGLTVYDYRRECKGTAWLFQYPSSNAFALVTLTFKDFIRVNKEEMILLGAPVVKGIAQDTAIKNKIRRPQ